jgi:hypothetical protein
LNDRRILITEKQWDWYREDTLKRFPNIDVDAWMEEAFIKYEHMPLPPTKAQLEVQDIIRKTYKTETGESLHIGYYRGQRANLAPNPDISGVRGLGYRPNTVYIDETHYTEGFHCWWGNGVTPQKWLEHRMFCTRTVLACLSGE